MESFKKWLDLLSYQSFKDLSERTFESINEAARFCGEHEANEKLKFVYIFGFM